MAKKVSKNARGKSKTQKHFSKWGGEIVMHTVMENGKIRHFAECIKSGKTARRPKDLM